MMDLEATHMTTTREKDNRLVCELYPGILVLDGLGIHSVQAFGNNVVPLPAGPSRTFSIAESTAEEAADRYKTCVRSAELDGRSWPPQAWTDRASTAK